MIRASWAWAPLLSLAATAIAAGRDDYEFGQRLLDGRWFHLAQELFQSIANDPSLSAERRAEGAFGLAQLQVHRALAVTDADQRRTLSQQARQEIQRFLEGYPNHPLAATAKAYLGYLLREDARALARVAAREPERLAEARRMLEDATQMYLGSLQQLGREPPQEDPRFDQWIDLYCSTFHELIATRYTFAEILEPFPALREPCRASLRQLLQEADEFDWTYGDLVSSLVGVATYAGRAAALLARLSPREEAPSWWEKAWAWFAYPINLKDNPENDAYEEVPETVVDGALWESRARLAYSEAYPARAPDTYARITAIARAVLARYPEQEGTATGQRLRIEQARALFRSGRRDEAQRILSEVARRNRGTLLEYEALDVLTEVADNAEVLLQVAQGARNRGQLADAAQKYRRATALLPAGDPRRAECWLNIGHCYYSVGLLYEAIAAYSQILEAPDRLGATQQLAQEAAVWRWRAASRLAARTNTTADRQMLDAFERYGIQNFRAAFGDEIVLRNAFRRYREGDGPGCIEQCRQIQQQSPSYPTALALMAACFYKMADERWQQAGQVASAANAEAMRREAVEHYRNALENYTRHYERVRDDPRAQSGELRNGLNSLQMATWLLSTTRFRALGDPLKNPQEILRLTEGFLERFGEVSEQFVEARPWPAKILQRRIFAFLEQLDLSNLPASLEQLQQEVGQLEHYREERRAGLDELCDSYQQAYAVLHRLAGTAPSPEQGQLLRSASEEYMSLLIVTRGVDPANSESIWLAASYFFRQAERQKNPELYRRARELAELYVASELDASAERRTLADQIRSTALRHEGNFNEAIAILQRRIVDDPNYQQVPLWEELADCLRERYDAGTSREQRQQDIVRATDIYGRLANIIASTSQFQQGAEEYRRAYWRLTYKWLEALSKHNVNEAWQWFALRIRSHEDNWDNGEFGFAERLDQLAEVVQAARNAPLPERNRPRTEPAQDTTQPTGTKEPPP